MDCSECAQHVRKAIEQLKGVHSADVFHASQKAVVHYDGEQLDADDIGMVVELAGYKVSEKLESTSSEKMGSFTRRILTLLALAFGTVPTTVAVLFISTHIKGTQGCTFTAQLLERVTLPTLYDSPLSKGSPPLNDR